MKVINNAHEYSMVFDRILQEGDEKIIKLSEEEKFRYRGAGDSVARFIDGELVKILYPLKEIDLSHNENIAFDKIMDISLRWVGESDGAFFMVTCKGCDLYNPVQISFDNEENINRFICFIKDIIVGYNNSVDKARKIRISRKRSENDWGWNYDEYGRCSWRWSNDDKD